MSEAEDGTTVTVTSKGQATIPKEFRDKLRIDTPGRVRFVENDEGEVVIRPVERPSALRGALADDEAKQGEALATELLHEERARDRKATDEAYDFSDREQ